MKGATVENYAIAISTLKTSNVPISGTSQNFLRSFANPHRSFNKSNIVRLTPVICRGHDQYSRNALRSKHQSGVRHADKMDSKWRLDLLRRPRPRHAAARS